MTSSSPKSRHRGRSIRTRFPDRYDPYLVDECTFTRDEICQARGLLASVAH